jgi:hypothetical protein
MSEAMADVYGAVTDRILINLAKYFPFLKAGVEMPGSFDYQARMLAQMGQINKETIDIIMSGLEGSDQALRQALEASIIHALEAEEPKLRKAAEKGILQPPSVPEVVPGQMQAFQAYYKQSADKLNLVNTVMLESTQAAYTATVSDIANKIARTQSILNVGAGEVVTGVTAYNQAVRESVKKMVFNGITGFVDHGGHHWSPEAYAAMDIRTTMNNVARAATWERNEGYGNDLYQVSWHNGARPLCYPWQGKVISRSDLSREVEDLDGNTVHVYAQSETSYGEPAGLMGINCGHYPMVFIPGISTLYDVPQDEEENAKDYEESQQQRALERKLRYEKRDLEVLKAQGASEDLLKAQQAKVKKASHDIDDFCEETGRTRRRDREATPINAKFPPKESYNPAEFPTTERDKMREFFTGKKADVPETVNTVDTNIEKLRSAAEGATNKVEFWMNMSEEQQAAFQASGLTIDEAFNMVKDSSASVSEWKKANPGSASSFSIKHDFSKATIRFNEIEAKSEGWMADANQAGVINVRKQGLGNDWDFIIAHEAGHQLSDHSPELQSMIMYNPGNVLGRYNTRLMAFDGVYGEYNPEEAFATSVSNFVRHPNSMKEKYPEAYNAIKALFDASPSARDYVERIMSEYRRAFIK